jgi:hypothetical protein
VDEDGNEAASGITSLPRFREVCFLLVLHFNICTWVARTVGTIRRALAVFPWNQSIEMDSIRNVVLLIPGLLDVASQS